MRRMVVTTDASGNLRARLFLSRTSYREVILTEQRVRNTVQSSTDLTFDTIDTAPALEAFEMGMKIDRVLGIQPFKELCEVLFLIGFRAGQAAPGARPTPNRTLRKRFRR